MRTRSLSTLFPVLLCGAALAQQPAQPAQPAQPTQPAQPAQPDQLHAARERAQKTLQNMQNLPNCTFEAKWQPVNQPAAAANQPAQVAALRVAMLGGAGTGECKGRWHGELLVLDFQDQGGELLQHGRRAVARDDGAVALYRRRAVDGNAFAFTPDPQQLLFLLASMDLAVIHREVGTLNDRPVEILTVALSDEQMKSLLWSDLVPAGMSAGGIVRFAAAGGGAPARPNVPAPVGHVDVALFLDPALAQLQRIVVRSTTQSPLAGMRGGVIMNVNGQVVNQAEPEDDSEDVDPKAPLQFQDGLPKRPKKGMTANDFILDFSNQGTTAAPAFDDRTRALLGLPPATPAGK